MYMTHVTHIISQLILRKYFCIFTIFFSFITSDIGRKNPTHESCDTTEENFIVAEVYLHNYISVISLHILSLVNAFHIRI